MIPISSIYRLMRLDKPVGIFLLWWPTFWALWMVKADLIIMTYFALGTVLMRSAGCVVNDIADRHFDLHVRRTQHRPLTSGEISLEMAFAVLMVLLILALVVLLQLPKLCFYYALPALCLAVVYPFCKRFLPTPQAVLALAFSMGIPMAFAASGVQSNRSMFLLLLINILWVLAYDTIYACLDRADDIRIGVHSTARYWAKYDRQVIAGLQISLQCLWLILAFLEHVGLSFYLAWFAGSINLGIQQYHLARFFSTNPSSSIQAREALGLHAFKLNAWYGFWMGMGLIY